MHEISDLSVPILLAGLGTMLMVGGARAAHRTRFPTPLLFLLAGIVIDEVLRGNGKPALVSLGHVPTIGTSALIAILFAGGVSSGLTGALRAARPIVGLGLVGTALTAIAVAAGAHWGAGIAPRESVLIGIALSPTDPAAVFSMLAMRPVRGRAPAILGGEAGINDPVAIALMLGALAHFDGHGSAWHVVATFALQLVVGLAAGALLGTAAALVANRVLAATASLGAVLLLGGAAVIYAVTALLHGSGFLAVLVAGLVVGEQLKAHPHTRTVVGLVSELAEIALFIALGMTIHPAALWRHAAASLLIFLILTFIARPAVTFGLLAPARLTMDERGFVAWGGLKGAVPLILAALATRADGADGQQIYATVFAVVVGSVLVQGGTAPWLAQRLGGSDHDQPAATPQPS